VRNIQPALTVHVAQPARLPRSAGRDRGHEGALFDYLTLELSPAFPRDSLIAVEITRTFEGKAVVTRRAFGFEDDRPIAA
jgi:exonuclease SbcC